MFELERFDYKEISSYSQLNQGTADSLDVFP